MTSKGPRGKLIPGPVFPPSTLISSRLAPPKSAASPLATGCDDISPIAVNLASSRPLMGSISNPVSCFIVFIKSGASAATRSAAVAPIKTVSKCSVSVKILNRLSAANVATLPVSDKLPVRFKSRPNPASTFSL